MTRRRSAILAGVVVIGLAGIVAGIAISSRTRSPVSTPSASAQARSTPTSVGSASVATAVATAAPHPIAVPTAPGCPSVQSGPPSATFDATYATALAFAPDGRLFYTERTGTVRVVEANVPRVFAAVATVTTERDGGYSERGLLGLAISPTFTADHYVYAMYDSTDYAHRYVVRWIDCGGTGVGMTTLITVPAGNDCCHKGGRLAFGPDGKLYVTVGEEHSAPVAQDVHDVRGKVLRYNPDGSIPPDNPFGAGDPVWAFGLRNPFGIAFAPDGRLLVTSNGPSGDAGSPGTGYDTADTITRGTGYQWPLCYGFSHPISGGDCGGQQGPDWSSENGPTVVPTGATYVDAHGPAAYAGHFVFCSYAEGMKVLAPGSPHSTVTDGSAECKFDVKEGPDGAMYFSDEGHIFRAP